MNGVPRFKRFAHPQQPIARLVSAERVLNAVQVCSQLLLPGFFLTINKCPEVGIYILYIYILKFFLFFLVKFLFSCFLDRFRGRVLVFFYKFQPQYWRGMDGQIMRIPEKTTFLKRPVRTGCFEMFPNRTSG